MALSEHSRGAKHIMDIDYKCIYLSYKLLKVGINGPILYRKNMNSNQINFLCLLNGGAKANPVTF